VAEIIVMLIHTCGCGRFLYQRNIEKSGTKERNTTPKMQIMKRNVTAVIKSGTTTVPPKTTGMTVLNMPDAAAVSLDWSSMADCIVLLISSVCAVAKSPRLCSCETIIVLPQYGHFAFPRLNISSSDAPQVGQLNTVASDIKFLYQSIVPFLFRSDMNQIHAVQGSQQKAD
jgi:hypothetical protein